MKNIAILLHSLTAEFSIDLLSGINEYFKNKDVKLLISQIKQPHYNNGFFDYQYWAGTSYLFSEQIDGIIILSGSFSQYFPKGLLVEHLKVFQNKNPKPIISIGMDLQLPESKYLEVDCKSAYYELVKHLKKHGCTKFAFISADNSLSAESNSRFEAYREAIQKNDLEYHSEWIYYGDFTTNSAKEEFSKSFKKKSDVKFDALICANDNMAVGCMDALQKIGIKIPDDVKVAGFDNTIHSTIIKPSLTTISQKITEQGYKAASLIYKCVSGKSVPVANYLTANTLYRQSCGCIKTTELPEVYKSAFGKIVHPDVDNLEETGIFKSSKRYLSFLSKIESVQAIFDLSDASSTLEKMFYSMPYAMETANIKSLQVCFFEKPLVLKREQDFVLPQKVELSMAIDSETELNVFEPQISFNPHECIIPNQFFEKQKGTFILQPIFSGEKNYGYVICRTKSENYAMFSLILKIIVNSLAQSYEYTVQIRENVKLSIQNKQLIQNNSNLDEQSKTDELTHVLNRRGFMELGKKTIDLAVEMDSNGLLFFADMDGLKKINDTYGHEAGDAAIKSIASILTQALRANDIVARLGGDEFACIAIGMDDEHVQKVRNEVEFLCRASEQKHNYPFKLSVSIGTVEFNKEHSDLKELLSKADERLYVEKNLKHSQENK